MSAEDLTPELMKKQMTEAEWAKIYEMSTDRNLFNNLVSSFFPSIHGNVPVKKGTCIFLGHYFYSLGFFPYSIATFQNSVVKRYTGPNPKSKILCTLTCLNFKIFFRVNTVIVHMLLLNIHVQCTMSN